LGVTSQTTGGQIEGITWNTSQGFSTALGSFVAQNYTAKKMERAYKAYRYTLYVMGAFGAGVTLAFNLAGETIFSFFVPEKAAYEMGGKYLFILSFSQIFEMVELTTQGMFNGLGKTSPPAIVSIVLNTLRIPLAVFLALQIGVTGVWWAIAISSTLKGIILPIWLYFWHKKRLH
jgi:Na+-driven multidrug efflux pump